MIDWLTKMRRLVRMDSFKGATALSITFNDGYLSGDNAIAFLSHIAGFMLLFTL